MSGVKQKPSQKTRKQHQPSPSKRWRERHINHGKEKNLLKRQQINLLTILELYISVLVVVLDVHLLDHDIFMLNSPDHEPREVKCP